MFQLSTLAGSENQHIILKQKLDLRYAVTNLIEGMCPFFNVSMIPILSEFMSYYQQPFEAKTGCGFDMLFPRICKQPAAVIHEVSMFHPPSSFHGYTSSWYDESSAFAEINHVFNIVYPKLMRAKYGDNVTPLVDTGRWGNVFSGVSR